MEYKYYREMKHNYLVVKNEDDLFGDSAGYQAKILEKGKLTGFVPCNMRVINNEKYLYYEINSMQSIHDRFSAKGMDMAQLQKLLSALKTSLISLSEYLLGMENVMLDTKSVFTDLSTGDFHFMYCPFKKEQADFAGFVDELFNIVDHDDEAAVELIYKLSEKAQVESTPVLECIEDILEDDEPSETSKPVVDSFDNTQEFVQGEDFFIDIQENSDEEKDMDGTPKKDKGKLGWKAQLIFGMLFMLLLAAMMYIRMNYILTKEEDILSIIVLVLSMVSGLVSILTAVKDMDIKPSRLGKKRNHDIYDEEEDDTEDAFEIDNLFENDKDNDSSFAHMNGYKNMIQVTSGEKTVAKPKAIYGETKILSFDDEPEKEITLYSRNAEKTIRISLDQLPITVGKMEECVDKVISDSSISRIHCRFKKNEEGRVVVVDLNSTNGTYKNGLRLKAQQENYLDEGDELRIGRICFDCR